MSSFDMLSRAVSLRYNREIKKSCRDLLECLNLNHFYYTKITDSGFFSTIDSHPDWHQYYTEKKLYLKTPYFCCPNLLDSGFQMFKDVKSENYSEVYNAGKEKFEFRLTLQLIEKSPDGVGIFGFSSNFSNEIQMSLFVNELPLIRLFSKKFCEQNPFLISKMEDNQIDIASIIGPAFYDKPDSFTPTSHSKRAVLEKIGVQFADPLTLREIEVIRLLLQGYSAGKIASRVFLSKRTVEHHVERVKEKLGCDSKAELIQKAREIELLGFLTTEVGKG